jgi:hypothetical protein
MMIFPGKIVALNRVGKAEISTVELPRMPGDDQVRYETCVFYDDAGSEVFDQYDTIEDAHASHNIIFMGLMK